jgi:hypothetical protein
VAGRRAQVRGAEGFCIDSRKKEVGGMPAIPRQAAGPYCKATPRDHAAYLKLRAAATFTLPYPSRRSART